MSQKILNGPDESIIATSSKRKYLGSSTHKEHPTKAVHTETNEHNISARAASTLQPAVENEPDELHTNGSDPIDAAHEKSTDNRSNPVPNDEIALLKLRLAEASAERKECALKRQLAEAELRARKK